MAEGRMFLGVTCDAGFESSTGAGWCSRSLFKGVMKMLVLSRKANEGIRINDDITIVVVAINGDKVRLGFLASKDHQIHRQEVYDKIQAHGSCRTVGQTPGQEV